MNIYREDAHMAVAVIMPRQGNTVESCIITEWKKKPGDSVAVGDIINESTSCSPRLYQI